MEPNSESDEDSVGGAREWEVVTSDSGLSEFNHDGQVHEREFDVNPEHFSAQQEEAKTSGEAEVKDWIEPSTSGGNDEQELEIGGQGKQQDLELLSSLVSSVLESEKREDEELEGLQQEVLAESGFSSLVPSDVHGNVLRAEEVAEEGGGGGAEEEEVMVAEDGESLSWKRKLENLSVCIKRASTLWSITIAAALMGLVIIGQRWHHERSQNHQLRLQLCYKDEKISQLLFQIARLKEAVSGRRRVPVIKASSM